VFAPSYLALAHGKHDGLGIGLASSRPIALSHEGTLIAERRHPTGVRLSLNLGSTIIGLIFRNRIARPLSDYVSLYQYTNM
jgi:K+-sensing histidine kinase KdpD